MPTQRLSKVQTQRRLREIGIEQATASAFTFSEDEKRLTYDWHTHRRHQLLYAVRGTARLEAPDAQFLLPPQRAAWIPAGLRHLTHVGDAETVSVYFDRTWSKQRALRVFEVPPLLREVLLYARRWPPSRKARDQQASDFFRAMLGVVSDLAHRDRAYELPRAHSELTRGAMAWVLGHLERAELGQVARHVGTTERTLRRRFLLETGLHFRSFVMQARVQRGMELLTDPRRSVIRVALEVGFASHSAFSFAFRRATGQTPRAFRATGGRGSQPHAYDS